MEVKNTISVATLTYSSEFLVDDELQRMSEVCFIFWGGTGPCLVEIVELEV